MWVRGRIGGRVAQRGVVPGGGDDEAAVAHGSENRVVDLRGRLDAAEAEVDHGRAVLRGGLDSRDRREIGHALGGARVPRVEHGLRVDADRERRDRGAVVFARAVDGLAVQKGRVRTAAEQRVTRVDAAVDDHDRHARAGRGRLVGADVLGPPSLALEDGRGGE